MQTSVQDYPGRIKLWHVGVPPSGPMDALGHRLANALVGNDEAAAALEFSLQGGWLARWLAGGVARQAGGGMSWHDVAWRGTTCHKHAFIMVAGAGAISDAVQQDDCMAMHGSSATDPCTMVGHSHQ